MFARFQATRNQAQKLVAFENSPAFVLPCSSPSAHTHSLLCRFKSISLRLNEHELKFSDVDDRTKLLVRSAGHFDLRYSDATAHNYGQLTHFFFTQRQDLRLLVDSSMHLLHSLAEILIARR